jgi:hypothetical protein
MLWRLHLFILVVKYEVIKEEVCARKCRRRPSNYTIFFQCPQGREKIIRSWWAVGANGSLVFGGRRGNQT